MDEVRTAIWMNAGNVTAAAEQLKVTSLRLRNFIKHSPYLLREQGEAREQVLDKAESVVLEALNDEDASRKDTMARYVLSNVGKGRGYGAGNSAKVNINSQGGNIIVSWADGSQFGDKPEGDVIDGECSEEAA